MLLEKYSRWVRFVFFVITLIGGRLCILAAGQASPGEAPVGTIRLPVGRTAAMKVTVENKCPQAESFTISTERLPAGLVRASGPISIPANSSTDTELTIDTNNLDPGQYSGNIVVTCTSCGPECRQDRRIFPVQFIIEQQTPVKPPEGSNTTLQQPPSELPKGNPPATGSPVPTVPPSATPSTTSKEPCPCKELCLAAISAEATAQGKLERYESLARGVEASESLLRTLEESVRYKHRLAAEYEKKGRYPDEVERLRKDASDSEHQIVHDYQMLRKERQRRNDAAQEYREAATAAAFARADCDACLAEHPDCPRSPWKAAGFTTSRPPDPDGPYLHGPDEPPPVEPPTTPGDHEKTQDCPQRHHGCVALVIDMMKNDPNIRIVQEKISSSTDPEEKKDYERLLRRLPGPDFATKLKAAGCSVEHVQPDFLPSPQPFTFSGPLGPATISPTQEADDRVEQHNREEQAKVDRAIQLHRMAVAGSKPELAMEIIYAHGRGASGGPNSAERCGSIGPGFSAPPAELFRADFHEANYRAAKRNVCSWFTLDISCYSGLTPTVVDELENLGTSSCKRAGAIGCDNHAGWESDGSMATATAISGCGASGAVYQASLLGDALDRQAARHHSGSPGTLDFSSLIGELKRIQRAGTSFYSDRGYAKDHPPIHVHAGYPTGANPAPCSGGRCGQ